MSETITTPEALDALPSGTVLVDPLTDAVLRVRADEHDRADGVETLAGASWALSHGLVVVWPRPDAPAPSAEDREALADLDRLVSLATSGCSCCAGADAETTAAADRLRVSLAARQPAPVRWGVFSYDDGRWYQSEPSDRVSAEQNRDALRADGEACDVVDEATGHAMQNAVAHARQPAPVDAETTTEALQEARELLLGAGGLTGEVFVLTSWHIEDGRVVADEKVPLATMRTQALRDALAAVERVASWTTEEATALTNAGNSIRALIRESEVSRG